MENYNNKEGETHTVLDATPTISRSFYGLLELLSIFQLLNPSTVLCNHDSQRLSVKKEEL